MNNSKSKSMSINDIIRHFIERNQQYALDQRIELYWEGTTHDLFPDQLSLVNSSEGKILSIDCEFDNWLYHENEKLNHD